MIRILLFSLLAAVHPGFSPEPESSVECLSTEEKDLFTRMNQYRKERKLSTIPLSGRLSEVARLHARDLAAHYQQDNNPCNIHSWSANGNGNWTPCCYTNDHREPECMWNKPWEINGYPGNGYEIAYFYTGTITAQQTLDAWKKSAGHHAVIINSGNWKKATWRALGIGTYGPFVVAWFGETEDDPDYRWCP
jgi:uncharacterized protein YkwD